MCERRPSGRMGLVLGLGFALGASSIEAQESVSAVTADCAVSDPALAPLCLEAVLALQAARGGLGIAASQGTAVPGSTSTLGRRLGTTPRVALALRGGLARVGMPDARTGESPAREKAFWAPSVEGSVTLGVLEGLSLLPTVGGFLSLDLLGSVSWVGVGSGSGFEGALQGMGYGARLGLLRESFTLPGVSVSLARRHFRETRWGNPDDDAVALAFRPRVTSVRATAGKDFLAFGILGGWGWERYGGSARLDARFSPAAGAPLTGQARGDDFTSERQLFFGGLSYTFLVVQLAVEGGFATGWDEAPGRAASGYDPTAGTIFGSVSGRLTF